VSISIDQIADIMKIAGNGPQFGFPLGITQFGQDLAA